MCTIATPQPPTPPPAVNVIIPKEKTAAYDKHWVTFLESVKLSSLNKDYAHFRLSLLSFRSLSFSFSVPKVGNVIKVLAGRRLASHRHTNTAVPTQETYEWMNRQTLFLHSNLRVCVCGRGLRLWPVGKWRPRTPPWPDQRRSPPVWWTGCTFWRVSWRAGPLPWRRSSLRRTDTREREKERVKVDCQKNRLMLALHDTSSHKDATFGNGAKKKKEAWAQSRW